MRPTASVTAKQSGISRFFRNPATGELVVAQAPNVPLWVFLGATAVRLQFHPDGAWGVGLSIVSGVAIVMWSVLEIVGGLSPFRRVLGAVVLLAVLGGLLVR